MIGFLKYNFGNTNCDKKNQQAIKTMKTSQQAKNEMAQFFDNLIETWHVFVKTFSLSKCQFRLLLP